jgi:long-chain acyl-CoA synthetase
LNFLLVAGEVAYHLQDAEAVALIAWEDYEETARAGAAQAPICRSLIIASRKPERRFADAWAWSELLGKAAPEAEMAQTAADDTAVILYTSGTTGRPKGAELTHFNLHANARWSAERSQSRTPDEILFLGPGYLALAALPLFHTFGQTCVQNTALFHGGACLLMSRWDPEEALALMERHGAVSFSGVPTMYFGLLQAARGGSPKPDRLRYATSGGAPMPVEVLAEFETLFPVRVLEGYGLSETSPVATFHTPEFERRVGTVGKAIAGCEVRVVDDQDRPCPTGTVGEVVIRGHNVMKGYYRQPDATAEALRGGWFHSGDLGTLDADGYLAIVDRKKDMILRGGFNVYPRELEEVIYAHPAVREASVVGIPHPEHGEEVVAVLALKEGHALTEAEFVAYCRERMAAYKYPRIVQIREALPKGATGKILKRELRDELRAALNPRG